MFFLPHTTSPDPCIPSQSTNVLRPPAVPGSRRKRTRRNLLSQLEKESRETAKTTDDNSQPEDDEIEVGGDPVTSPVYEDCHEVLQPTESAGKHSCRDRAEKPRTETKSSGKLGRRWRNCGVCSGCTSKTEDCGSCVFCLDKRKFGGSGIKKKACIGKKCIDVGKSRTKSSNSEPAVPSVLQQNEESEHVNIPSEEVQILEVSEEVSSKPPIGGKKRTKPTAFVTPIGGGGQMQKIHNQQRSRMSTVKVSKLSKSVRKEAIKEKLDQYSCPILPCKRQCRNAKELRLHFLTSHFLEETNREFNKGELCRVWYPSDLNLSC